MSKTPDFTIGNAARARRVSRVAYTLDNDQPVRCTIIGDQPLFYMDYEGDLENEFAQEDKLGFGGEFMTEYTDAGAEDMDIAAIEDGLHALQDKILDSSAFRAPPAEPGVAEERLYSFIEDIHMATLPVEPGEHYLYEDVADLTTALRASRLAASFADFAADFGIELAYSQQVAGASYERDAKLIYINPRLPRGERLLLAARELRRVWQHKNGALLHPLTFHPDQAVLVNRAQMADLSVAMIRIAWELQLAGEKDAWERVEGGAFADLARAFAREAYADFRTLNNGVAASAVFEGWFLSERCRFEDRKLIQQMLADYQGYVFDGAQASQAVTAELIAALGTMPFGKNYLAPYVATIMGDALFTEVRDRSNANFLWFIKFERSFREAEQELQSDRATDGGASATDRSHKNNGLATKHEEAAIIALPFGSRRDTPPDQNAASGTGGAQIIAFRSHAGNP